MLEKLALPNIKEELPRLHASHAQILPEEAEIEYLKVFAFNLMTLFHFLIMIIQINGHYFQIECM